MGEPIAKVPKGSVRIGTHDGTFHCDEVFACYMLKLLPQYKEAVIVRSRDESVLDTCDIVVDVGAVFDPAKHRYDHHQRSFEESMSSLTKLDDSLTIKLSSAGLVYAHFGKDILRQLVPKTLTEEGLEAVYLYVYSHFVQEIDAIDNGVPICNSPRYKMHTHLSARVGHLNPGWDSPREASGSMERFNKAMDLVAPEFEECVSYAANSWWPARSLVLEAIKTRTQVHESGHVMELKQFCPWSEHFFDLLQELGLGSESVLFVIFKDGDSRWRVRSVPMEAGSYILRVPLCPDWQGLRDEELSKKTGIEGCVFVHASGFIGGNKTREGVLKMALKSIELHKLSVKS